MVLYLYSEKLQITSHILIFHVFSFLLTVLYILYKIVQDPSTIILQFILEFSAVFKNNVTHT